MASLSTVFAAERTAENPLLISSIKGNIGHCEAASGAAGLAKLLLMMQEGKVPLQAGFRRLNPCIARLASDHLVVPTETTPWPQSHAGPRRAILNNFGAAGSNTMLLLEASTSAPSMVHCQPIRTAYVFNLSAKGVQALEESILQHQHFLDQAMPGTSLKDICYTATVRRCLYETRISMACQSIGDLKQSLQNVDLLKISQLHRPQTPIFIFSGQGASHRGMAKELVETCPMFRKWVHTCDIILQRFGVASVLDYLMGNPPMLCPPNEDDICLTQCACVTLEYALAQLLISWNIRPSYLIGHRYVRSHNLWADPCILR